MESKRIESPLEAVKNNGPGENVLIGIGLKFIVTTGLTKLEVLLTRIALPGQALAAMAAVIAAKRQMVVTRKLPFLKRHRPRDVHND